MKKFILFLLLCAFLSGCGNQAWETVSDQIETTTPKEPQKIKIALPNGAVQTSISLDGDTAIYFCDGYTVCVAQRTAGDMAATLKWLTGLPEEELTVLETKEEGCTRYYCAWCCAGENGQQVCRAEILDDGNYHYTVSILCDDENAVGHQDEWEDVFQSFSLGQYSEATS